MGTAAFERLANKDNVIHYVTYIVFVRLCLLDLTSNLYPDGEKFSEPWQYVPEICQLLRVFQNLPDSMVALFEATRPSPHRPTVIVLEEVGMPVNKPTKQASSVTTIFANCSNLHSHAK